jgi:hypothetical protein
VLPGRVIRRGILALQREKEMSREIQYKKIFVRYISHEIR